MNRRLLLISLLFIACYDSNGQGQYTFTYTPSVSNSIPFSTGYTASSSNRRQLIYYPTNFPTAPSGNITTIYLRLTAGGTKNITNMFVNMGPTTQTIFTTTGGGNAWITGLSSVYSGPFSGAPDANLWLPIPLQTPFYYDNTQNFALDMGHYGYTAGFSFYQGNGAFVGRGIFGVSTNATGSVQDRLAELSFDIAPLPLKLLGFDGTFRNGVNALNWKVAEESDMAHYIVQRSFDGREYDDIATVSPLATSDDTKQYTYADEKVKKSSISYYRLKMVELNGTSTYSPVVRIMPKSAELFVVDAYPNPFSDQVSISVTIAEAGPLVYEINDLTGNSVTSGSFHLQPGMNNLTVPGLQAVAPGVYSLSLKAGNHHQVIKLSK